ncbi:hypothetical protein EHM76_03060, partial [bacterium]
DAAYNQLKSNSADPAYLGALAEFKKESQQNFSLAAHFITEAKNSFTSKDYTKAVTFLEKSLNYKETPEANEMIGMIELNNGNRKRALSYFEKAYSLSLEIKQGLLYRLSKTYLANQDYKKARNTFEQLKKNYPGFSDPDNLESKIIISN